MSWFIINTAKQIYQATCEENGKVMTKLSCCLKRLQRWANACPVLPTKVSFKWIEILLCLWSQLCIIIACSVTSVVTYKSPKQPTIQVFQHSEENRIAQTGASVKFIGSWLPNYNNSFKLWGNVVQILHVAEMYNQYMIHASSQMPL